MMKVRRPVALVAGVGAGLLALRTMMGLLFARHACRIVFNRSPPSLFRLINLLPVTRPGGMLWRFLTAPLRTKPRVFVLGETRCASTTLSYLLRERLGFVGPFTPWVHPLANDKESFFFVGHFFGVVAPSLYAMCFPLRLWRAWQRLVLRSPPPMCFDGCASYFSAPWVPELLKRACGPSPVLVVCLREPVSQHISWWRLEHDGMAWGSSMGLGDDWLQPPIRLPGYPPPTLRAALDLSRSAANVVAWQQAATAWQGREAWPERLPEWALPFPNGQLAAFDRMGRYADNLQRWLEHFDPSCFVFVTMEEITQQPAAVLERIASKCVEVCADSPDESAAYAAQRQARRGCCGAADVPKLNASTPRADDEMGMDDETLRELGAYYRPHNERLFRLIGRDLGWHDNTNYPWYRARVLEPDGK